MRNPDSIYKGFSGKRVLITGATGFIGGRLVELLAARTEARIRILVNNRAHACRVARFPVEMIHGDILDASVADRATADCSIVFHCAYGNAGAAEQQRAVNVHGTENILQAARSRRVQRVVYLSTILVYGETPDGEIDERAPRRYLGNTYADSKLDAEKLALDGAAVHGVPVAVLQPAEVYGPYGTAWTERVLRTLKSSREILVDGGSGLVHPLYVDDLIDAMVRAALLPAAVGEAFLIRGPSPITWEEFYGAFERMLGSRATVSMSRDEAEQFYQQWSSARRPPSVWSEATRILYDEPARRRLLKSREARFASRTARLLPLQTRAAVKQWISGRRNGAACSASADQAKPINVLDPVSIRMTAGKTVFSIDKARRLLNYVPRYSFPAGMQRTEQWARWANLL